MAKEDDELSTDELLDKIKSEGLVSDRSHQVLQGLSNLLKLATLWEEIEGEARAAAGSDSEPAPNIDELLRQFLKKADFSDLRGTLFWHAANNFSPDSPVELISLWKQVILWINEGGNPSLEIELPEGFSLDGKNKATAWEIVLFNNLGPWIEEETYLAAERDRGIVEDLVEVVPLYKKYLPYPGAKLFPDSTSEGRAISAKERQAFFSNLDLDAPAKEAFIASFRIATEQPTNEALLRKNPSIVKPEEQQTFLDNWRRSKGDWTDEEMYSALKNGL